MYDVDNKGKHEGDFFMNETRHLISDTSRQLNVEPHVLRYWEEELDLKINRNEMGHRLYTADDIRVLQNIQAMKEQGFQLKAIKLVLAEMYSNPEFNWKALLDQREVMNQAAEQIQDVHNSSEETANSSKVVAMDQARANHNQNRGTNLPVKEAETEVQPLANTQNQPPVDTTSAEFKMEQFQEIMTKIIGKALEANNRSLTGAISNEVSDKVSDRVIKQMDYVMREKEEKEEERFRKLDEAIRMRQKANAEVAAAAEETKRKKKKKLFGKKNRTRTRI